MKASLIIVSGPWRGVTALSALALATSILLAACGGGEQSAAQSHSVYPAVAAMAFAEVDAQGTELQRSAQADAAGAFDFPASVTAARLHSVSPASDLQLPALRSARIRGQGLRHEITPLTTLFDQLIEAGKPPPAAQVIVLRLIGTACGAQAAASAEQGLYADTLLTDNSRAWLLYALGAYLDSFRGIGLTPATPRLDWAEKLEEHSTLLAQMCDTARSLFAPDWVVSTRAAIASSVSAPNTASVQDVAALLPHAAQQVLALMATRLPTLEHPQMPTPAWAKSQVWRGTEEVLARQLIEAELSLRTAGAKQVPADSAVRYYALDARGHIVHVLSGQGTSVDAKPPVLRIENVGTEDRQVQLSVNGFRLADLDGVLAQIVAMPATSADEPLWRRAWRFVGKRTRWGQPITGGLFWHQPDLFLRSIGSSECDVLSSALHWIWLGMGYDARVHMLSGHLVAEVMIGSMWEMYDPTFGVYYLDRTGAVASVDALANDPDLITEPVAPILPIAHHAYSQQVADSYATRQDNWVEPWYSSRNPEPLGNSFVIPRGGHLELVDGAKYSMQTRQDGVMADVAPVRLWVPPGFSGSIDLPLILADITGDGSVSMLDNTVEITSQSIAPAIIAHYTYGGGPATGIARIQVGRVGASGITVTMAANPLYFDRTASLIAAVQGTSISGLRIVDTTSLQ